MSWSFDDFGGDVWIEDYPVDGGMGSMDDPNWRPDDLGGGGGSTDEPWRPDDLGGSGTNEPWRPDDIGGGGATAEQITQLEKLQKNMPASAFSSLLNRYKDAATGVFNWGNILRDGAALAGGYAAYRQASQPTPPTGYQGGIPKYTALRQQTDAQDPTVRPGSGGHRYFTDMQYAKEGGLPAAQAAMATQAGQLNTRNAANAAAAEHQYRFNPDNPNHVQATKSLYQEMDRMTRAGDEKGARELYRQKQRQFGFSDRDFATFSGSNYSPETIGNWKNVYGDASTGLTGSGVPITGAAAGTRPGATTGTTAGGPPSATGPTGIAGAIGAGGGTPTIGGGAPVTGGITGGGTTGGGLADVTSVPPTAAGSGTTTAPASRLTPEVRAAAKQLYAAMKQMVIDGNEQGAKDLYATKRGDIGFTDAEFAEASEAPFSPEQIGTWASTKAPGVGANNKATAADEAFLASQADKAKAAGAGANAGGGTGSASTSKASVLEGNLASGSAAAGTLPPGAMAGYAGAGAGAGAGASPPNEIKAAYDAMAAGGSPQQAYSNLIGMAAQKGWTVGQIESALSGQNSQFRSGEIGTHIGKNMPGFSVDTKGAISQAGAPAPAPVYDPSKSAQQQDGANFDMDKARAEFLANQQKEQEAAIAAVPGTTGTYADYVASQNAMGANRLNPIASEERWNLAQEGGRNALQIAAMGNQYSQQQTPQAQGLVAASKDIGQRSATLGAAEEAQRAIDAKKAWDAAHPAGQTGYSTVSAANTPTTWGFASGGIAAAARGRYLQGGTDGMADKISTNIDGNQEAALSHGEFVIPADVVSHLGNGNSDAGARKLYSMMDRIRQARTGTKEQGKKINPDKMLPKFAGGGTVQRFEVGGVAAGATGQESNLSNWVGPYVTDMLGKGQALSETPYQQYQGPLTAGASTLQTEAFNTARDLQVPTGIGQAAATAGNVATAAGGTQFNNPLGTFDTPTSQKYMTPYMQGVVDIQQREAQRQADIASTQRHGQMTQAGAFGGSRQAIMDAEAARNLAMQKGDIQAQGLQSAYTNAQGQFNAEQNRQQQNASLGAQYGLAGLNTQLSAASTQGGLYGQQQQAGLNNLNAQLQAGQQQRGITSEGIAADQSAFNQERDNPYKMVQFQQSLLQGLPLAAQSYNITNNPLAAAANTAGGIYSMLK